MDDGDLKRQFVEKIEAFFATQHLPRMAGRLLGWLLICDPPAQSAKAIGEALEMSKGTISTITRQLMQMGLVEKIGQFGARGDFYRLRPQACEKILFARQAEFAQLQDLSIQGLELLKNDAPESRARLLEMKRMSEMAVEEIDGLIARMRCQDEGESKQPAS